jgi:amino acid transporter
MLIAIGILSIAYGLFTVAMTSNVARATFLGSAIPQILFARNVLGTAGVAIMVLITLAASFGLFNAGVLTSSRFVYATAREHALPKGFSRLSKYMTPWVSILVVATICLLSSGLIILTGHYQTFVDVGAAVESTVYALAGLAVFRLRRKMGDAKRPFTVPGGSLVTLVTFAVFSLLTLAVLSQDVIAALFAVVGLVTCGAYVKWVVPGMKLKAQAARRMTSRRPPMVS